MSFSFFDFVNQDSGSSKIKSIAKGIKGVGVKVGFKKVSGIKMGVICCAY